jgi:alanine racemase
MSNLFQRPVWAEIDLSAIKNNVREIKKVIGDKKIIGVIKANAYGHGAVETGKALKEEGVNFFAVAILEEALELRRAGFEDEILILGWTPSEDYQKCLENNLILCLYDYEEGTRLNEKARELNTTARVHIKIDTGMSRIGFLPNEKSFQEILKIMDLGNISVEGIFSHLSKADEKNKSYAEPFAQSTIIFKSFVFNGNSSKRKFLYLLRSSFPS